MLRFLSLMFSEDPAVSAMRVMAFMSVLVGAGVAFYGLHLGSDPRALAMLAGSFVAPAFAGKAWQRKTESRIK